MFLKNEDIHLLIKMENIIGMNEKTIFGKKKDKAIWIDGMEITFDDFVSYINLIDRILQNKKKLAERSNAYNKAHPEKHRQLQKEYLKRHTDKRKQYQKEYYQKNKEKLAEYKKKHYEKKKQQKGGK